MADKFGIGHPTAECAIAALTASYQTDADAMQVAQEKNGIDAGILGEVLEQIASGGSLASFMQILDQGQDGNPMNDVAGVAGKLSGKG